MNATDYIPSPDFACHLYTQFDKPYYVIHRRVNIADIKIDKTRMAWPNPVYEEKVEIILEHFDLDQWVPVLLDQQGFLMDGQHRLEVARRLNLKFIDIAIEDRDLCYPKKPKSKKRKKSS